MIHTLTMTHDGCGVASTPAASAARVGVRGWARTLATAALVAVLAGCSSSKGPQPLDLGPNVVRLPVAQAWQVRVPELGEASLSAQVQGQQVIIASADGTISSIDAIGGQELWRAQVAQSLQSGVGIGGGHAAVVTRDNYLHVLADGRTLWRKPLLAAAYTTPLVSGGRVFVLTADRSVSAYDLKDGLQLWTYRHAGEPLVLSQQGVLMPLDGHTLLVGLSSRMTAFNADTGALLWDTPIATARGTNDVERLVDLVAPASRTADGFVCARAFQAGVGCVDTRRLRLAWTQAARGTTGIASDGQAVFGSEDGGSVIAWNQSDGSRLWRNDALLHRRLSAPLVLGRSVVVGDHLGQVHLLSRTDGQPLNRLNTDDSGVAFAPMVAADTLVVVTRRGGVYGFRPE